MSNGNLRVARLEEVYKKLKSEIALNQKQKERNEAGFEVWLELQEERKSLEHELERQKRKTACVTFFLTLVVAAQLAFIFLQ